MQTNGCFRINLPVFGISLHVSECERAEVCMAE